MTSLMNALGPGSCGNLNSSTMMVMMTAITASEKDSNRDGAGASGAESLGRVFGGIAPCPAGVVADSANHPAVIPLSLHRHYYRSAFVLNQEHDKFGWLSTARVPANDMNVVGAFVEGLTRCERDLFSALYLHDDRAFQHVDKRMCIVAMYRVRAAGRMLHCDHQTFLVGKVRQVFRQELRHLRLLSHERASYETYQHQT